MQAKRPKRTQVIAGRTVERQNSLRKSTAKITLPYIDSQPPDSVL